MTDFPADVIDWTEAMQQTGDDEEFLRELLADLRQETDTQMVNIEQIIQVGFYLDRGWCGSSSPSSPWTLTAQTDPSRPFLISNLNMSPFPRLLINAVLIHLNE